MKINTRIHKYRNLYKANKSFRRLKNIHKIRGIMSDAKTYMGFNNFDYQYIISQLSLKHHNH